MNKLKVIRYLRATDKWSTYLILNVAILGTIILQYLYWQARNTPNHTILVETNKYGEFWLEFWLVWVGLPILIIRSFVINYIIHRLEK